jgi:hypothetical protein
MNLFAPDLSEAVKASFMTTLDAVARVQQRQGRECHAVRLAEDDARALADRQIDDLAKPFLSYEDLRALGHSPWEALAIIKKGERR